MQSRIVSPVDHTHAPFSKQAFQPNLLQHVAARELRRSGLCSRLWIGVHFAAASGVYALHCDRNKLFSPASRSGFRTKDLIIPLSLRSEDREVQTRGFA